MKYIIYAIWAIFLLHSCLPSSPPDNKSLSGKYYPYEDGSYYGEGGGYNWSENENVPEKADNITECSIEHQNLIVLDYMWSNYLWYEEIPDHISFLNYDTPKDILNALKYSEKDRFSYLVKKKTHDDFYSGKYYGFGYGTKRGENQELYISLVYEGSPADKASFKRGMQILTINSKTIEEIDAEDLWKSIYGENEQGVAVDYKLKRADGEEFETTLFRDEVKTSSILHSSIIKTDSVTAGYIVLKSFISPTADDLDAVFMTFKKENTTSLIIDLRYNGGGLLSASQHFGSLIGGEELVDKVFTKLFFNSKKQDNNREYLFKEVDHAFPVKDVVFITAGGTASASELLINAMEPFVNVHIVGNTTYGKPVGMTGIEFCEQVLVPITFKFVNANNEGDFFDGIPVDCPAKDDVTHNFGNTEELSLKEAMHLLASGNCSEQSDEAKLYLRNFQPKEIPLKGIYLLNQTF